MKILIQILKFPFAVILQIGHIIFTREMSYTKLKSNNQGISANGNLYIEKQYITYSSLYQYIMHRYPEPPVSIKQTKFLNNKIK